MNLGLDPDELNQCVQCGLCLPHCPTFRVTGDEARSPRGRIHLMREVQNHDAPLTPEVVRSFETCVQCRGCEPACPSGVQYGHLIEGTRVALAEQGVATPWWQRAALRTLAHPRLLRGGSAALALLNRARLVPRRLGVPDDLPLRRPQLRTSGAEVHLFTGCVMDAWQRPVHVAAQRVLEAGGWGVHPVGDEAPCCGALSAHAGLEGEVRRRAEQVMGALGGDAPILVDSAGCGAHLKAYGDLLDTEVARTFSARVFDLQEWLAPRLDRLPTAARAVDATVAVLDPCHLRHVQRVHHAVRLLLGPYVRDLVELDDDGLCCGAGGAYAVLEPELAGAIRDRKVAAIERVGPTVVAAANPGCALHLAAAGVPMIHPIELVDVAIRGVDWRPPRRSQSL